MLPGGAGDVLKTTLNSAYADMKITQATILRGPFAWQPLELRAPKLILRGHRPRPRRRRRRCRRRRCPFLGSQSQSWRQPQITRAAKMVFVSAARVTIVSARVITRAVIVSAPFRTSTTGSARATAQTCCTAQPAQPGTRALPAEVFATRPKSAMASALRGHRPARRRRRPTTSAQLSAASSVECSASLCWLGW